MSKSDAVSDMAKILASVGIIVGRTQGADALYRAGYRKVEACDTADTLCESRHYRPRQECDGPARFAVVYRHPKTRQEIRSHAACFLHGMAEVDRHVSSGGIAVCDLEERSEP